MGAPAALVRDLEQFRGRLESLVGAVDRVVLFGSQARGETHRDSDVDVLIVSPAFEGKTYVRRAVLAGRAWDLPYPVDFLCYTPAEFERLRGQVSIVRVALEEGVDVGASA